MKNFHLFLVLLFVLSTMSSASAQHRIGLIGGLNLANISEDPEKSGWLGEDYSIRTAFGIGGVFDLHLGKNISMQIEPMYLQKGSKFEAQLGKATIKLTYIEVPVMFKLSLGKSITRPYFIAGPTFGILLNSTFSYGEDENFYNNKDDTRGIDWALAFGTGLSFTMSNKTVFVEGRYALGLSDINVPNDLEDADDPAEESVVKNKGIQIMGGITFPLGQ